MSAFEYAKPKAVEDSSDCFFYHKLDLPDVGEVGDSWDLRSCIDDYLGQCDFKDRRVLDVGTASGFLTFEMEKQGADVVSFDMPSSKQWNVVPHYKTDAQDENPKSAMMRAETHRQLQNAYWFAHRKLRSKAQVYYGDIYNLPVQLGNFDTVVLGMIVTHLRDPFQAIYSAARLSRDLVIVTNQVPKLSWWKRIRRRKPNVSFINSATEISTDAWWFLPPRCISRMLGTIGFEVIRQVESYPHCLTDNRVGRERCVSVVARRCGGIPAGIESGVNASIPKAA